MHDQEARQTTTPPLALATQRWTRRMLLGGVLTVAAGAVTAACGASSATISATLAPAATPSQRPGPAGTATPVTASPVISGTPAVLRGGVSEGEVRLGTWGPQDGPGGALGAISRVQAVYYRVVNAAGGVAGRRITLVNENDSYQPTKTAAAVRKLVEVDRVFALVGGVGTPHNLLVLDYLVQNNVLHLAPATGIGALTRPTRPTIFCAQPSYASEATLLTRYALDTLGVKKLAVCFQNDPFGKEGAEAVQAELRQRGSALASEVAYETTDRNYRTQALRLAASGAEASILCAVPQAGAELIQEFGRVGAKARVLALSAISDPALFDLAGPGIDGLVVSTWLPDPADTADPKVAQFRQWLQTNAPNESPTPFAMAGYLQAQLAVELLTRTGPDLTQARFIETAHRLQNYAASLLPTLSYTPDNHRGATALSLQQAKLAERRFVKLTDFVEVQSTRYEVCTG